MGLSTNREIFKVKSLTPKRQKKSALAIDKSNNLYGEDLSFKGCETQHSTHALHTYVAAINPPLARKLIETYIPEGESILDPFCGGGGVLVEAALSGRVSTGGEINPLGLIISKAKTTHISKKQTAYLIENILQGAHIYLKEIDLSKIDSKIRFWFKDKQLSQLVSLSKAFADQKTSGDIRNLFQAILSATIRDVMLTYRGEVRLSKLQNKDFEKFDPDTFAVFEKRARLTIERVDSLPTKHRSDINVRDVRDLPFEDNTFHSIVCSPPYADDKNGVGYFQFSKNMLSLLGFTPEEIKDHRSLFLGVVTTGKTPPKSKSLSKSLKNVLAQKPEKYNEAVAFYSDYAKGLSEMVRVTRDKIIIVIGNRVLARTEFDNAAITVEVLKDHGVELLHHYTRVLNKKRIPNLGGDGGGINVEHILVFKK